MLSIRKLTLAGLAWLAACPLVDAATVTLENGWQTYRLDTVKKTARLIKCTGTSLTIPEEVFYKTDLYLEPYKVTSIGAAILEEDGAAIKTVRVPATIESIDAGAFRNGKSLRCVIYEDSDTPLATPVDCAEGMYAGSPVDSVYMGRDMARVTGAQNTTLRALTIGPKVTTLSDSHFANCTALRNLYILDGDTPIVEDTDWNDKRVFYGCLFHRIYLGRTIGQGKNYENTTYWYTFVNQTELTDLTIGPKVKEIPAHEFDGCTSLTRLIIPGSVEQIGNLAFAGGRIRELTVEPGSTALTADTHWFYLTEIDDAYIDRDLDNYDELLARRIVFGDNVTKAGSGNADRLESVSFGRGITELPAMSGFTHLTRVSYTGDVATIAFDTFKGCTSLKEFSIRPTVRTIESSAFDSCPIDLKVPATVETLYMPCDVPSVTIAHGDTPITLHSSYRGEGGIGSLTLDRAVTSKDWNKTAIDTLTIGPSLRMLPSGIVGNSGQKKLVVKGDVDVMGSIRGAALEELRFEGHLGRIDAYALNGARQLRVISAPNSGVGIGDYAFSMMANLESVNFGGGDDRPGLFTGMGDVGVEAFKSCSGMRRAEIIADSCDIASKAFAGLQSLESVSFSGGATINESAFEACPALAEVTFGGRTSVGRNSFKDCTGLKSVDLTNVTSIDINGFFNCTGIKSISIPTGLKKIGNGAFEHTVGYDRENYLDEAHIVSTRDWYAKTVNGVWGDVLRIDGAPVTHVLTPEDVATVPYHFASCKTVSTVTLAAATTDCSSAFSNCTALEEVRFEAGSKGFRPVTQNYTVKRIIVPESVEKADISGISKAKDCHIYHFGYKPVLAATFNSAVVHLPVDAAEADFASYRLRDVTLVFDLPGNVEPAVNREGVSLHWDEFNDGVTDLRAERYCVDIHDCDHAGSDRRLWLDGDLRPSDGPAATRRSVREGSSRTLLLDDLVSNTNYEVSITGYGAAGDRVLSKQFRFKSFDKLGAADIAADTTTWLSVSGLSITAGDGALITVQDTSGRTLYRGNGTYEAPAAGIYVVSCGSAVSKVALR